MYKLYQINSPKNRTETGLLENLHFDEKRDVICLHKKLQKQTILESSAQTDLKFLL